MARKSVMIVGADPASVTARADVLLAGKHNVQTHSDIVEYHQHVVAGPRDAVESADIPEFNLPKGGGPLYFVPATYE